MHNSYPGERLQTRQSRLPFAGYEWDPTHLDQLRTSGFIEAYATEADLMIQQSYLIERATILPSMLFSTRVTNQKLVGFV